MAVGYTEKDKFILYTLWHELGPKKRSAVGGGPYWACTALLNLCDKQVQRYPVAKWEMHIKYKPAALKFIEVKKAKYAELKDRAACEELVIAVYEKRLEKLLPGTDIPVDTVANTG